MARSFPALGRDKANRVIFECTFCYTPGTSFADAARVTVQSARPSRFARSSDTRVVTVGA
jgi:hypothetical protein